MRRISLAFRASGFIPSLYDLLMAPVKRGPFGAWRKHLAKPAHGRVLEVGAGTGLNFSHYRPGTWLVATDVNFNMIRRSTARASNASADIMLIAADAEALPFRNHTFTQGSSASRCAPSQTPNRRLRNSAAR